MQIVYTIAPGRGDTDLLLHGIAQTLAEQAYRLAGTVQINSDQECEGPCDMDVRVLPDGPVIRISQDLGREARGCRLDPEALESAVALVEARLKDGADCLIINKFGKHEADGRGFRNAIGEALARDIPVLVGLNTMNLPAFDTFTAGPARALPPDHAAIMGWLKTALDDTRMAG